MASKAAEHRSSHSEVAQQVAAAHKRLRTPDDPLGDSLQEMVKGILATDPVEAAGGMQKYLAKLREFLKLPDAPPKTKGSTEHVKPFSSQLQHDMNAADLALRSGANAAHASLQTAFVAWETAMNARELALGTAEHDLAQEVKETVEKVRQLDQEDCVGRDMVVFFGANSSAIGAMATFAGTLDAANVSTASAVADLIAAYVAYATAVRAAQVAYLKAVEDAHETYWSSYEQKLAGAAVS